MKSASKLVGRSGFAAGLLWTFPRGSINMGTIQLMIWTKMPARSCGRRNCSPRLKYVIDSLVPGKSRTGNHQLPPQIYFREEKKMLVQGSSSSGSGKNPRHAGIDGNGVVMPRILNPGFVTFVGKREPTI
jgi:hypothetical protein